MASKKEEMARRAWRILIDLVEEQKRSSEDDAERFGLSQVSAYALYALSELPAGPISQLAARLAVDPGWATDIIDKLEEYGAVRRVQSDEDRRVRVVDLTPMGRRVAEQLAAVVVRVPPAVLALREDRVRALLAIAEELQRTAHASADEDLREGTKRGGRHQGTSLQMRGRQARGPGKSETRAQGYRP